MLKLISWNIDSLNAALTGQSERAEMSRQVLRSIADESPDIIAIQETKLPTTGPSKKHKQGIEEYFPGYKYEWVSSTEPARKGYSGTMVLYRAGLKADLTLPKLGAPEPMDYEGRLMTLDFGDFYFVNVYTPNAGNELNRLEFRQVWDRLYADYLEELDQTKAVIATGDFNVAHEEIDLAHPENNRRSAGFTDEEREGFSKLLSKGFTDSFRHINGPVEGVYSWWAQRVKTSKINNSGWRIDYFLVSDRIAEKVIRSEMMDSGARQDHTPIILEIDL